MCMLTGLTTVSCPRPVVIILSFMNPSEPVSRCNKSIMRQCSGLKKMSSNFHSAIIRQVLDLKCIPLLSRLWTREKATTLSVQSVHGFQSCIEEVRSSFSHGVMGCQWL